MSASVSWIEDEAAWQAARSGWDAGVLAASEPSIFATWDFLDACWTGFARPAGHGLAVAVISDAGRPIGYAPLRVVRDRRLGLPRRTLRHLAGWESDRPPFVFPPGRERGCVDALATALEARADDWDILELRELEPGRPVLDGLTTWAERAPALDGRLTAGPPSPYLELSDGWPRVAAEMGPKLRRNLKKLGSELCARGPVRLEAIGDPTAVGSALDAYLGIEARSWKGQAGQGVGKSVAQERFYRDLLPRLAREGRAEVSFLQVSDVRVAGLVELRLADVVWAAQMAFDAAWSHYSPGNQLLALALERHARRGVRRYELQAQFVDNKRRFTRRAHPNADLRIAQGRRLRQRLLRAGGRLRSLLRPVTHPGIRTRTAAPGPA